MDLLDGRGRRSEVLLQVDWFAAVSTHPACASMHVVTRSGGWAAAGGVLLASLIDLQYCMLCRTQSWAPMCWSRDGAQLTSALST